MFITGRRKDTVDEAVAAIGHNVTGVQADSGNLDDLARLAETVREHHGRVDVLFASAGIGSVSDPLGSITPDSFDTHVAVNFRGTVFTVQYLLPLMSDGASIILNGTTSATTGPAKRSRPPRCSSPLPTPASSPARTWSSTAGSVTSDATPLCSRSPYPSKQKIHPRRQKVSTRP